MLRGLLCFGLILGLGSCSWAPEFEDPEKQKRFEAYHQLVRAEVRRYHQRIEKSSSPWIRFTQQHWHQFDAFEALEEAALSDEDAAQVSSALANLVRESNRSKDHAVRLAGLFVHRACRARVEELVRAEWSESALLERESVEALVSTHAKVCPAVRKIRFVVRGLESFDRLIADLMPVLKAGITEDAEFDLRKYSASVSAREKWLNTERLAAYIQLQLWQAARRVKTVPAPEEFKNREVSAVDIVLGNYRHNINISGALLTTDLYAMLALMPCDDVVEEFVFAHQEEACREIASHFIKHSQSLSVYSALELLEELDDNDQPVSPAHIPDPKLRERIAWLAQHDREHEPLESSESLSQLRRKLERVRGHGSLALLK